MANAIYPKFLEQILQSGVNLSSANIKAVLVDLADYTYSSAHEFLTSVPGAARVATSANLGTKTFTNGTFDTADTTFAAATGDQSEAVILYVDTGTEATSRLIVFRDAGVTGLPVTPNGGDITVAVASGWFTLGST
jgi:3-mercaptopyruvate sulfurtransferase SseA